MTDNQTPRIFLVVVDDSEEMPVALHYASRRARHTKGRVALLRIIQQEEVHGLASVAALMREENRQEAEELLHRLAQSVTEECGAPPTFYIREGVPSEQLIELVNTDPTISTLVLAANAGPDGPGPLVSFLATRAAGRLRIPVTIVPGGLTREQIAAIS